MFFPDHTVFVLVILLLAMPFVLYIINFITAIKIKVDFSIKNKFVAMKNETQLKIIINNDSALPVTSAKLYVKSKNSFTNEIFRENIVIPIVADNSTIITTQILSKHCGKIVVSIEKIKLYDYLYITSFTKKLNVYNEFIVLPVAHLIESNTKTPEVLNDNSNRYSTIKSGDDPSQVFDYHEYSQGDKIKNINWKLSSRLNILMVKEFSLPISCSVLIMMELYNTDNNSELSKLDTSFETLISISNWLSKKEILHDFSWYSKTENYTYTMPIENQENLVFYLEQAYNDCLYDDSLLLNNYNYSLKDNTYSHAIYITSILNEGMLSSLYGLNNTVNVTVLYVTDDNLTQEENDLKTVLELNDIHLIILSKETIASDLQEIAL